jgi:tetratricopeptide (TPR) repeat protein
VRYRTKKLLIRRRKALSIAGVIGVVLIGAGALVWSASQRASLWAGEMDRFYEELLQSRSIAFGSVRSADEDNRLDAELRAEFADDPQGEIAKRIELIVAANRSGDLAQLEMHSRRSLELLHAENQPLNAQWIDAHSGVGIALRRQGKPVPAIEHIERALAIAREIGNTDKMWEQEYNRAIVLRDARKLGEAEEAFKRVLEHRTQTRGPADSSTLRVVASLAALLSISERANEGERMIREAMVAAHSIDPVDRREVLRLKNTLGLVLLDQGKAQDAAILLEACLNEMQEAGMGESPAATAVQHHLARAYMKLEEWQQAERLCWQAMNARVASAGQQDSFFLRLMTDRTQCLVNMGRTAEASAQLVVLQSEITYQLRWISADTLEWHEIQRLLGKLSELETQLTHRGLSTGGG